MLFLHNNKPLLWYTVLAYKEHVNRVVIVTGAYHESIKSFFDDAVNTIIVHNPDYEKGMFTSVKTGMARTTGSVVITPGDIPLIKPSTIETILNATGKVRLPVYQNRKGHPLYLDASLREALLEKPDTYNLKAFRNEYHYQQVEVQDSGVLFDVDTQEAFLVFKTRKGHNDED